MGLVVKNEAFNFESIHGSISFSCFGKVKNLLLSQYILFHFKNVTVRSYSTFNHRG